MLADLFALGAFVIIIFLIFWFLALGLWIWQMVRLSGQENKTNLWIILAVGLMSNFFGFFVGWFLWWLALPIGMIGGTFITGIVGLFLGRNEEKKQETEKYFWCGICNIKYKEEFLGGETAHEGKICRSCLVKKQRGETNTFNGSQQPHPTAPISQPVNANIYQQPEYRKKNDSNSEKRILSRELSRKQRKRNNYLTQFIINLAVLQWLLPLIAVLIFWLQLKEQMKVQAMNNHSLGLATEIPFGKVIKDFFKILTSEFYVYGGHNISINLIWKIGIILAFLLSLGFWIYNLVRFFGLNGEVNQLQAEIKEIEH